MPSAVGRYRIDRVLGSGAFASVWLAHDEVLDSQVAVKVLAGGLIDDLDVRSRFLEEAKILRRADSERLVRVHDIGELDDGRPYFVMSYADLGTLADRMRRRQMPLSEALELAAEVARGVEVINRLGLIHRDLKPSNVLFQSTTDGGERLLIADLGLAKALAHASGAFTLPVGTPGYMSPEQARFGGGLDVRADVYGLGALTYHLVTGRAPSTAPVVVPPSAIRPELPQAVDEVVMRALETDRERRWPSAEAFAGALAAIEADDEATVRDPAPGSAYAAHGEYDDYDHTVADPTTADRSSGGEYATPPDPSGFGDPAGQSMRVPRAYEPTSEHRRPEPEHPADRTVEDIPIRRPGSQDAAEVRTGATTRGRVLAALGLAAVLVAGGGGAYAIAKLTGAGSSDANPGPGDGLVAVTDTTGRLTLRVPPAWKLQTGHNTWPVPVSDAATAPAMRATPDYDRFVRDDVAVPGVFAGLTHDMTVSLPPAGFGSHRAHCGPGAARPYRHGTLSGEITRWTCGGSITIDEVRLRDSGGRFQMWVRVKLTGPPDLTQKILDSIQTKG
jgi:serine/threonine protein kinase